MSGSRKQRELCPVLSPFNKQKCAKAPVWVHARVSGYVRAYNFTEDTLALFGYGYANGYVHYVHRQQVDVRECLFFTATLNGLKYSFAFPKLLCFKCNSLLSSRTAHSSLKLSLGHSKPCGTVPRCLRGVRKHLCSVLIIPQAFFWAPSTRPHYPTPA